MAVLVMVLLAKDSLPSKVMIAGVIYTVIAIVIYTLNVRSSPVP